MDKVAIDKWIESSEFHSTMKFDNYYESVIDKFEEEFFDINEDKLLYSDTVLRWMNKCYDSDKSIASTAVLIERIFRLYKL